MKTDATEITISRLDYAVYRFAFGLFLMAAIPVLTPPAGSGLVVQCVALIAMLTIGTGAIIICISAAIQAIKWYRAWRAT